MYVCMNDTYVLEATVAPCQSQMYVCMYVLNDTYVCMYVCRYDTYVLEAVAPCQNSCMYVWKVTRRAPEVGGHTWYMIKYVNHPQPVWLNTLYQNHAAVLIT